ncbi:MAG: ABC transporter ATP-binding protein [Candidatus Dojkabacteria bacterium]
MNNSDKPQSKPIQPGFGGRPGGPGGGGAMMTGGAKAKNFTGSIGKLASYMKPFVGSIIVVFIFAIGSTIFTIVSPKILGNITNQIVTDYIDQSVYDQVVAKLPAGVTIPQGTTGADILKRLPPEQVAQIPSDQLDKIKALDLSSRPTFHFDDIEKIVLLLIGLYILSALFNYAQGYIMSGVSQKITFKLRANISEKINTLPLKYFDTNTNGDILSRITNDVDTIGQSLNQSLTSIVTSITTIIGIALFMISISWELTIVAILVIPVSFGFIAFIVKRSQKLFSQQQVSLGQINGHIEEMYAGHSIVKAYNGEKESLKKFSRINNDLYDSGWKSQFFSGLLFPIINFVGNLGYVAVAVLGGYLAINGRLQIGDIQAFIQYLQQFNQPIIQAANIVTVLQSTAASAERVFEFLEEKDETLDSKEAVNLSKVKGDVEFDNVIFGYNPDKTIIKGFTANAAAGQRIAIVGPTGAGKTTMVNLLMRFYDVNSGSIKVDGVDIKDMKRSDVRKLFGMVLQDTWLFNGTIRDNILYGKPDATEAELNKATKAAHVDHFVHSLPNGYDMVLNEAVDNISQGEKQLLTIARAMLVNPPMLILDEATSSVDTRTEVLIQQAMENLMKDRTSFVIAHRLSTIKNADLILVMNQGNIVEQGTHDELIAKKGFYENLYNSQFAE